MGGKKRIEETRGVEKDEDYDEKHTAKFYIIKKFEAFQISFVSLKIRKLISIRQREALTDVLMTE